MYGPTTNVCVTVFHVRNLVTLLLVLLLVLLVIVILVSIVLLFVNK